MLYAINTAGAVLGTIVAGFVLLPLLGLRATVWLGVAVNASVFLIAARLAKHAAPVEDLDPAIGGEQQQTVRAIGFVESCIAPLFDRTVSLTLRLRGMLRAQPAWILPLIAFSGANAFFYEVLWTRLLNHVLGGSIYAFATMLASFLAGIALGGAVAGKLATSREKASLYFAFAQCMVALLSALVYFSIGSFIPEQRALLSNALFAALVMLPATIFIGTTFPLAVRVLSRDAHDAANATARTYSWNTVGAIAGAIAAGFYLIPALGFEGSIKLTVAFNLLLALASVLLICEPRPIAVASISTALALVIALYVPPRPLALVNNSAFAGPQVADMAEVFFAVGRSSTVQVLDQEGAYNIRTNGLPEASVAAKGVPPVKHSQKWLTALPIVARPDSSSLLLVGFGGGVALEGVPQSVESIDVVELEPQVINANRLIAARRGYDPLSDPRVTVIINDARNALKLTRKRYDVIVSQPSHPWTAGASHLFSSEFAELVRDRLHDKGVFLQWMNAGFVDGELLKSMGATLSQVFTYVRLYQVEPTVLLFLGSDAPLDMETGVLATGRPMSEHLFHYSQIGLNGLDDLVTALVLDEEAMLRFVVGADISTDNANRMATHSKVFAHGGLDVDDLVKLFGPYDPLLNVNSVVHTELAAELNFSYIGTRLVYSGAWRRAEALAKVLPDRSTALQIGAKILLWKGKTEQAEAMLRAAINADPDNVEARYQFVQSKLASLVLGTANEETIRLANSLSGAPYAIVRGWSYGAEKNWPGLARIDRQLAASELTDSWYPEAVQLRAEWRTKVAREDAHQYAHDAIRMLDRALLITPDLDLYVLRTASAYLLDDPDAFVESARYVGWYINSKLQRAKVGDYDLQQTELDVMETRLIGIEREMKTELVEPVGGRAEQVRAAMLDLLIEVRKYGEAANMNAQ